MFDLFNSMDAGAPGEVEMVSLVPNFDEEPVVEPEIVEELEPVLEQERVEEPESVEEKPQVVQADTKVAMSRCYEIDGKKIEIAYINYNKVRITRTDEAPVVKEFASTKEAVDYYVEQMQELEKDE